VTGLLDLDSSLGDSQHVRLGAPSLAALVDFAVTGTKISGEFRCSDCGYGAVVQQVLPPCPMCGGTVWETRPPRLAD